MWSPDSNYVVYCADQLFDNVYELFVMDVCGLGPWIVVWVNLNFFMNVDVDNFLWVLILICIVYWVDLNVFS